MDSGSSILRLLIMMMMSPTRPRTMDSGSSILRLLMMMIMKVMIMMSKQGQ